MFKKICPSGRGRQGHTPHFSLPYTLRTRWQKQKHWKWDETTTSFYMWHHTASFSCHSLSQRSGQSNIYFQCGGLDAKSCPTLVTPWTVAHQVPLSMGFPRQGCWSGFPFSSPLAYNRCLVNLMEWLMTSMAGTGKRQEEKYGNIRKDRSGYIRTALGHCSCQRTK